jgi:hypothetical protein
MAEDLGMSGEQAQRDRLWPEERGELQEPHRRRVVDAQPFERDAPCGVHSALVAEHVAAGQEIGAAAAESPQVVDRG